MKFKRLRRALGRSLLLYGAGCGSVSRNDNSDPADAAIAPSDLPVNTSSAGTVDEGETLSLTDLLVTTDPDTATGSLVYTVRALPGDGQLRLEGTELAVGDTFTQEDVDEGRVSYVHDGAENATDEFAWDLSDGPNTIPETGTTAFAISVNPINDAPAIANNVLTSVAEGGIAVLDSDKLLITDAEGGAPLTYTFLSITRGSLRKRIGAGPYTVMSSGDTFTQQDIVDSNVRYNDSGVDDAMLQMQMNSSSSFSWRASDPDGATNPSPTGENVTTFTVTSVNDAPTLAWQINSCYQQNVANPANPLQTLSDVDNPNSAYQICVVAIGTGSSIIFQTGQTVGTTVTGIVPTLRDGGSVLGIGSCVNANAVGNLTFTSSANSYGGYVTWRLMLSGVQVGPDGTDDFNMPSC